MKTISPTSKIALFSWSLLIMAVLFLTPHIIYSATIRHSADFTKGWKFHLGDATNRQESSLDDSQWRILDLPHDWSIEGEFNKDNPATPGGGALPGGIGCTASLFPSRNQTIKNYSLSILTECIGTARYGSTDITWASGRTVISLLSTN